jgi:hypothetical protein
MVIDLARRSRTTARGEEELLAHIEDYPLAFRYASSLPHHTPMTRFSARVGFSHAALALPAASK